MVNLTVVFNVCLAKCLIGDHFNSISDFALSVNLYAKWALVSIWKLKTFKGFTGCYWTIKLICKGKASCFSLHRVHAYIYLTRVNLMGARRKATGPNSSNNSHFFSEGSQI